MAIARPRSRGSRKTLVEDRQRGGHNQSAADAHQRPAQVSCVDDVGQRRRHRAAMKITRPVCSAALRPKRSEATGGKQETGEHQHVGLEDPLELAGGGVEVAISVGTTTLRIVLSRAMITSEMHSVARISQRRAWTCGSSSSASGITIE